MALSQKRGFHFLAIFLPFWGTPFYPLLSHFFTTAWQQCHLWNPFLTTALGVNHVWGPLVNPCLGGEACLEPFFNHCSGGESLKNPFVNHCFGEDIFGEPLFKPLLGIRAISVTLYLLGIRTFVEPCCNQPGIRVLLGTQVSGTRSNNFVEPCVVQHPFFGSRTLFEPFFFLFFGLYHCLRAESLVQIWAPPPSLTLTLSFYHPLILSFSLCLAPLSLSLSFFSLSLSLSLSSFLSLSLSLCFSPLSYHLLSLSLSLGLSLAPFFSLPLSPSLPSVVGLSKHCWKKREHHMCEMLRRNTDRSWKRVIVMEEVGRGSLTLFPQHIA